MAERKVTHEQAMRAMDRTLINLALIQKNLKSWITSGGHSAGRDWTWRELTEEELDAVRRGERLY